MTIFDILARLKNVKGPDASGNYLACCPAHDDKKQSLSVKQGDKGVVMKCYAGCGVRDICARLGIEMKDLYEDKPREPQAPKQQRKIVKTYPYTDKDGKLLFEVVRYEPKSFSQRMPDPDKPGQWIWKSCPVQPLYRLPEVNKAIAAGEYVCIAEGEKDAETLARLGYCGTSIAMGAGKWKTQHTEQLQGAKVLLFADNDAAGMSHVKIVSKALAGTAKSVSTIILKEVWPEMPDKADVTDLAEKFGDEKAKELIELAIRKASSGQSANAQARTPLEQAQLHDDTEAGRLFSQVQGYTAKDGCICQFTSDGGMKPLCTFTAIPRSVVTKDDGVGLSTGFDIEGWDRTGGKLGQVWVSGTSFNRMDWVLDSWGFKANIMPGTAVKDKLRYVIAEVGAISAARKTLYIHTGWRKIDGKDCFLHAGGAIGNDEVSVQLEGKLGAYDMSGGKDLSWKDACRASMKLMEVMDERVALPLLGMMYLAPLCSILEAEGLAPRFSLYLLGATQTRKTTAALLAMSHFGNFNAQDKIPASFTDTANSIQRSAFLLKDMPILVDDYFPVGSVQARRKMEETAQSLSRSFGNGGSRGRLNSDMTLRATYPPRGVAIMTGEDLPDIKESGLGRFLIINLGRESVPVTPKLSELQRMAQEGYLRKAMRGYVQYVGGADEKKRKALRDMFMDLRTKTAQRIGEAGYRSIEAVAHLTLAIVMMAGYFKWAEAITQEENLALIEMAHAILIQVAERQAKDISEQKPTAQFIRIVSELLQSARFKCLAVDETSNSINVLGYMDQYYYYFFPETVYQAVSKFCSDQGTVFPVSLQQLRKQLADEGRITAEMGNKVKKIRGRTARYLWMPRTLIDGERETPPQQTSMDMTEANDDPDNPFTKGEN